MGRKIIRTIIATWAIVQFLIVSGYASLYTFREITADDGPNGGFVVFEIFMAAAIGIFAAILSMGLPAVVFYICKFLWKAFGEEHSDTGEGALNLTTGDIAGIASALHPRTGALFNVAANIDARTQALVQVSTPPAHNPVDDERL